VSQLPHAADARVDDAKVRDYLLNPYNPQNRGNAGQFGQYGFTRDRWEDLAAAIASHAIFNQVIQITVSRHGTKYVVACELQTPDRRNPCLRSVWIIEPGRNHPRLVTAY